MRLVVVGATGAVGSEMLRILEERPELDAEVVAVASQRSAGRLIPFRGGQLEVQALEADVFRSDDLALFDVPDEISAEWAPIAASKGALAVDNSAAFRMDPEVPLVVPEVNPTAARNRPKGIIASPNCTTLAMVVPVAALHREVPVERLILASYQAVSGAGKGGVDELWDQTEIAAKEADEVRAGTARNVLEAGEEFAHPIALNVIPQAGSVKEDGYTSEELKLCNETRKIMGLPDLRVTATCVRVPVMIGHGVAVHAEFSEPITPERARALLEDAEGVEVQDDVERGIYPTPLESAGRNPCFVGRIRQDRFDDKALEMFCVADNLRKGAALNTIQVAGARSFRALDIEFGFSLLLMIDAVPGCRPSVEPLVGNRIPTCFTGSVLASAHLVHGSLDVGKFLTVRFEERESLLLLEGLRPVITGMLVDGGQLLDVPLLGDRFLLLFLN